MRRQVTGLRKPLIAVRVGAYVRFLASMCSQVCPQIEVKGEAFSAERTFEGLLACMNELMSFELGVVKKLLVASSNGTYVLSLSMSHGVFP